MENRTHDFLSFFTTTLPSNSSLKTLPSPHEKATTLNILTEGTAISSKLDLSTPPVGHRTAIKSLPVPESSFLISDFQTAPESAYTQGIFVLNDDGSGQDTFDEASAESNILLAPTQLQQHFDNNNTTHTTIFQETYIPDTGDNIPFSPSSTATIDEFSHTDTSASSHSFTEIERVQQNDFNSTSLSPEETANQIYHDLYDEFGGRSILTGHASSQDSWFHCFGTFMEKKMERSHDPSACQIKFDGASCWPETPAGALSTISCFAEFNGVPYDSTQNATLQCYENGTWAGQADYDRCTQILSTVVAPEAASSTKLLIYYVGYSISLVAVMLALAIFATLKDLRCLRNTIHANLLATYLLHNLFWLISATILFHVHESVDCAFLVLLKYSQMSNFMWMFVEGLYLYVLVVKTFSVENIKLKVYLVIGWGAGIPVILVWLLVRIYYPQPILEASAALVEEAGGCFLHHESNLNWLVRVPILLVLATNILFLCRIMWVLITKLRSANTVETQRYRKATKALLVLIPLLGLNYVLLIALPQALEHLHPCLLSTQGLWVALFYCFLNSEVQNSIRHHIARWRTERGLMDSRALDRQSRDLEPRSRNRLSRYSRRFFSGMNRKRESVCSEVTTTTTFITNGNNHPTHNFHYQKTSKQFLPLQTGPASGCGAVTHHPACQYRYFRSSQPNLTQTSCFSTSRCCADGPDMAGPTDISGLENPPLVPMYRPVSRNSNRTPSPFDPPNIPMITPPVLTPSLPGTFLDVDVNEQDLMDIETSSLEIRMVPLKTSSTAQLASPEVTPTLTLTPSHPVVTPAPLTQDNTAVQSVPTDPLRCATKSVTKEIQGPMDIPSTPFTQGITESNPKTPLL